jgi:hypothetical protein
MNARQIKEGSLIQIARRAIEFQDAEAAVRIARNDLFDACEVCKAEMGISEYIKTGTDAWEALADKTSTERTALQKAKRVRYNASRRLQNAVRRHRAQGE